MHKSVVEFTIDTIEVGGLGAALKALRLPFGKEPRSQVYKGYEREVCCDDYISFHVIEKICADYKDIDLMQTLVRRGDEHAKVLRGITVWCEINAPRYWWQECDRYSVGACCLASNSTMHQQGKGLAEDELVEMKEHLPEGTMQKRVWMFSYQTLRRIYFQRRNHRLPQWRVFCKWIESLPLADKLITVESDRDNSDKRVPDKDN